MPNADKAQLRAQIRSLKCLFPAHEKAAEEAALWARLRARTDFQRARTVLLYCALPDEPDTRPLLHEYAETKNLFLPVVTGEGTMESPFTVTDVQTLQLAADEPVWVVGYMGGTAYRSMGNAEFNAEARNNSNILLAADSLCSDAEKCIPVELNSSKLKSAYSLPSNPQRLHHCLLLRGVPSTYLHRKGLREVSAGLWMNGFDVAKVAPEPWGIISL